MQRFLVLLRGFFRRCDEKLRLTHLSLVAGVEEGIIVRDNARGVPRSEGFIHSHHGEGGVAGFLQGEGWVVG